MTWLHSAYMGCVPADWSAGLSRPIRQQRMALYRVDRYNYVGKQGPVLVLSRVFLIRTDCDVIVHSKQTTKKTHMLLKCLLEVTGTEIILKGSVFLFFF